MCGVTPSPHGSRAASRVIGSSASDIPPSTQLQVDPPSARMGLTLGLGSAPVMPPTVRTLATNGGLRIEHVAERARRSKAIHRLDYLRMVSSCGPRRRSMRRRRWRPAPLPRDPGGCHQWRSGQASTQSPEDASSDRLNLVVTVTAQEARAADPQSYSKSAVSRADEPLPRSRGANNN